MLLNFAVTYVVSLFTAPPPEHIQHLVGHLRYPGKIVDESPSH